MTKKIKQSFADTYPDRALPDGEELKTLTVIDNFDEVGKEQFVQMVLTALKTAQSSMYIHNQVLTNIVN